VRDDVRRLLADLGGREAVRRTLADLAGSSPFVTVEQAGKFLGLRRSTAFNAARAGEIPTVRFGRRVLVPIAALEELACGTWPDRERK
jgi:excisionase family DNA binding protein